MLDPKKLQEIRARLYKTELSDEHIAEHALEASQTMCAPPLERKFNLNALIGISALAQAMLELSDLPPDESFVVEDLIDKAAARLISGHRASTANTHH